MMKNTIGFVCFLLCLTMLSLSCQAQRVPSWIKKVPKAQNNTYRYVVEHAEGLDYGAAYNTAIAKVMLSTANRIGQPFDSKAVNAAVQNGDSYEVISRQYNIPFNKVCEYMRQQGGTVVVYVLCQVAVSGNVTPQWDEFRNCESTGDLLTGYSAVSWDDVKYNTANFIYGEGWGESLEDADDNAMLDLALKFSEIIANDGNGRQGTVVNKNDLEKQMKSYASSISNHTERMVLSNAPKAHVGRYIKRTELNKIFEGRKNRINEYLQSAMKAEKELRLDDALRYYNWSYTLLKTMRYSDDLVFTDDRGENHIMSVWIPERMNAIFDGIHVEVVSKDGGRVFFSFTYNNKPVTKLDYTYFDGRDWSNICSALDGRGGLELNSGIDIDHLQIKYEYMYKGQASLMDNEVEAVMRAVKRPAFPKSIVTLSLGEANNTTNADKTSATHSENLAKQDIVRGVSQSELQQTLPQVTSADKLKVSKVIDSIVNAIKTKNYHLVRASFTEEGWEMFEKLVHYGNATVLDYSGCEYTQMGSSIIARSIPMMFSFKRGVRKSFVENIVFTINENNKIECVAFGLDAAAMEDILSSKKPYSEKSRQTIINFLENYKTAFALKRIDYIESIFDNNAVIITGHVAYRLTKESPESNRYVNNKYVTRTRYTKEQYIANLRRCFNSQEFVNIRFSDNNLTKASSSYGETYGIQIRQDYYSTTYGDSGYLYLQVDLNDPDNPVIKVRTWQEEFDPELGRPYGIWDF